jgi:SAM-dependent methyltransferase
MSTNRLARSLKEVARHILHKAGVRRKHEHLSYSDPKERFEQIYETGVWRHGDEAVPGSGQGSSLAATSEVRSQLPKILEELRSECLLDVGCGDFYWMQSIVLPCHYIGLDIVPSVIENNIRENESSARTFLVGNSIDDVLPDADTVLCREVLFHLSLADGMSVMRNIISKPRKFVILTSDRATGFNSDIETGDFRLLNLEKGPFRLPSPFKVIPDSFVSPDRILGVWKADQVRAAILKQ